MSHYREILAALENLRSGASSLTSEQYLAVLEAVEQAAEALQMAPRGSDSIATAVWWHHERTPALARLEDALSQRESQDEHASAGVRWRLTVEAAEGRTQPSDAEIVRALHRSLVDSARL